MVIASEPQAAGTVQSGQQSETTQGDNISCCHLPLSKGGVYFRKGDRTAAEWSEGAETWFEKKIKYTGKCSLGEEGDLGDQVMRRDGVGH